MFKIIIPLILISGVVTVNAVLADEKMKENGFSEKQIFSALQTEYGREILAHPERSIPLWAAGIPLALILVFLGYRYIMTKKPNLEIIPDKKKYEQRFEEEYRKYVSGLEET